MAEKSRDRLAVLKPCPLCGTLLSPGERVHTVVYSGPTPGTTGHTDGKVRDDRPRDSLVHMFGCPYCHPSNNDHPRHCPVCGREIPADGYVVARMFEKPNERKHVHVVGCTQCRRMH